MATGSGSTKYQIEHPFTKKFLKYLLKFGLELEEKDIKKITEGEFTDDDIKNLFKKSIGVLKFLKKSDKKLMELHNNLLIIQRSFELKRKLIFEGKEKQVEELERIFKAILGMNVLVAAAIELGHIDKTKAKNIGGLFILGGDVGDLEEETKKKIEDIDITGMKMEVYFSTDPANIIFFKIENCSYFDQDLNKKGPVTTFNLTGGGIKILFNNVVELESSSKKMVIDFKNLLHILKIIKSSVKEKDYERVKDSLELAKKLVGVKAKIDTSAVKSFFKEMFNKLEDKLSEINNALKVILSEEKEREKIFKENILEISASAYSLFEEWDALITAQNIANVFLETFYYETVLTEIYAYMVSENKKWDDIKGIEINKFGIKNVEELINKMVEEIKSDRIQWMFNYILRRKYNINQNITVDIGALGSYKGDVLVLKKLYQILDNEWKEIDSLKDTILNYNP